MLSLSGLSGCVIGGFSDPPGGGDLVISNSDSTDHTVTVTVSKVSESDDDTRPKGETPDPEATPIWKRSERFTVPADESHEQRDFVTEPGAFFVETALATGDRETYWWGLYQASGDIAESALVIDIHNDGVSMGEAGA